MQAAEAMEVPSELLFVHKTFFPTWRKVPSHDGALYSTVLLLTKIRFTVESSVFPTGTVLFPIGTNNSRSQIIPESKPAYDLRPWRHVGRYRFIN